MISDADIDDCLSTEDFAQAAVFATSGGTVTVSGIFTEPTDAVMIGGTVETIEPSLMCKTSAIGSVRRRDTVTVNSATYTVERIQNTGTGLSVVYLKS
jgi:hypothetical protein